MRIDTPEILSLLATSQFLLQESELSYTTFCSVYNNKHKRKAPSSACKAYNALKQYHPAFPGSLFLGGVSQSQRPLSILTAQATGYLQSLQLDCPATRRHGTMCWTEERLGERGLAQLVLHRGFCKKDLFCQSLTCSTWWMNGAPHTPPGSGR